MLTYLSIQNMAIIESLTLDFNQKMTVLTGETGAGKSIIIDSIALLLGERASTDVIRHGEDKAVIEAIFNLELTGEGERFFEENDIDYDKEEGILIKRVLRRGGGSNTRVNGQMVTVNQLKALGNMLVDIHEQHDSFRLFKPEAYYSLLDNLVRGDKVAKLKDAYLTALSDYRQALKKYNTFQKEAAEMESKLYLIKEELEELDDANLQEGELERLEQESDMMASSDELHRIFSDVILATNGDGGAVEILYPLIDEVEALARINSHFEPLAVQFKDIYYNLEDFANHMGRQKTNLTYDPKELDVINERIAELKRLSRKYQMDLPELMAYHEKIKVEYGQLENKEDTLTDLLADVKDAHGVVVGAGEALNEARVSIAKKVKKALIKELADLKLEQTTFDITFEALEIGEVTVDSFTTNGLYAIDLLLSTNKGEPLKPLNKVASGGEMSRIMLALKSILHRGGGIGTIIFDEIDTGVSGAVAARIGAKMREIAGFKQVFCITHLPQVASAAEHHLHVSKSEVDGRTATTVTYLDEEARVHEIAVMMSDENVTDAALENAREMLAGKASQANE